MANHQTRVTDGVVLGDKMMQAPLGTATQSFPLWCKDDGVWWIKENNDAPWKKWEPIVDRCPSFQKKQDREGEQKVES